MPSCLKYSKPRIFTDYTNITTSAKSFIQMICYANHDLSNLKQWLLANKLSFNIPQTEQMFIGSNDKIKKIRNQNIFVDRYPVKRVTAAKSLGVSIDGELTWSTHVDNMSRKISRAISGRRKVRSYVPQNTLVSIFKS